MKKSDLKIMLISPLPPPAGGIATWTKQYVEWAEKNSLDYRIIDTSLIGKRAKKINDHLNIIDEVIRTIRILMMVFKTKKSFKPNIVHLNTPCGTYGLIRDFLCVKILKNKDVHLFIHYRCNIEDQIGSNLIKKYFLKRLTKYAYKNIVLNSSSKKYLKSKYNINGVIIPNYIDNKYIEDEVVTHKGNVRNVIFIGHIQKTKGFFEILKTAMELPTINFLLVGPVAENISDVITPNNIHFVGILSKDEVMDALKNADVFLFPTYTEGFSNALLEAMAVGLPVITTPVGANKDMIEEKGGFIAEVGDYKAIIKAILTFNNPKIRKKMSEWNLAKTKQNYAIDNVMNKLLSLYLK